VRFRVQSVHNLLDEALGASPPDVVARDLILPLFERLEAAGDPGAIRFASSLFEIRLLAQARGWDRVDGPLVVLACAPREERTLALIALGLALAARHCRIEYLGAATPASALRANVVEQRAALAVLSAERADLLVEERAALLSLGLRLIGRAAPALAASLGGEAVALDGVAVADEAHGRSFQQDDAGSPGGW
jgi:hypothetical protein